jgi:hypothetical protein
VSGGSSQFTEIRAGHKDANGNFVAATVPINDGLNTIANRSIINDRALIPQAQEHVPDTETTRATRAALNTLGDGFVEAIDDSTLRAIAQNQIEVSDGRIHGEAVEVPVLEAPGRTRIGRFDGLSETASIAPSDAGRQPPLCTARTARAENWTVIRLEQPTSSGSMLQRASFGKHP